MAYAAPSSADVAALLRTRTKTTGSTYPDDFSTTSNPTKAQVETLIGLAEPLVLPGLGSLDADDLGDACQSSVWGGAKTLVAMAAAMFVEASHWPEQQSQSGDQTTAGLMKDLLEGDLYDRIARAAATCRGETGGGDDDAGAAGPPTSWSGGFPEDRGGMIGHGSRW